MSTSVVDKVAAGDFEHEWVEAVLDGHEVLLSRDALKVDGVRVSVTATEAQKIADLLGAMLPTPEVLDLRYELASVKIPPLPSDVVSTSDKAHSQRVDKMCGGIHGIIANVGKHWVLHPAVSATVAVLYGWHVDGWAGGLWRGIKVYPPASDKTDAHVIQAPSTAHNLHHKDYSMTLVLVRPKTEDGRKRILKNHTPERYPVPKPDTSPDTMPYVTSPGERGPLVLKLQLWLKSHGYEPGALDGIHGSRTEAAVVAWREGQGGVALVWMPARHYRPAQRKRGDIKWVVLHTAEMEERPDSAEALGQYAGTTTRQVSWHYAVDCDTVVQCVKDTDVAFAAPGANAEGIQIELAGRAHQGVAGWADDYSQRQLKLTAKLVRELCDDWGIPPRKVVAADMLRGEPGICGHYDVTMGVGKGKTDHVDPGKDFPWEEFLAMVACS